MLECCDEVDVKSLGRSYFFGNHFGEGFANLLSKTNDDEFLSLGKACVAVASGDSVLSRPEKNYIIGLLASFGASPGVLNEINSIPDRCEDSIQLVHECVKSFKVLNVKFVLWHSIFAAASDGLPEEEIGALYKLANHLGEDDKIVDMLLCLHRKSEESLRNKLGAIYPMAPTEGRVRRAAKVASDEQNENTHLADSTNFAGRDETSSLFSHYDDKAAVDAIHSFFFKHEWGVQTYPPEDRFPPFLRAILTALISVNGELPKNTHKRLIGLAAMCAPIDNINDMVHLTPIPYTPSQMKSELDPHQIPVVAYFAFSCACDDFDADEIVNKLVPLFSETHVDKNHLVGILNAYNAEKEVSREISTALL